MEQHYDPMYLKSMQRNFSGFEQAAPVEVPAGDEATLRRVALALLEGERIQSSVTR